MSSNTLQQHAKIIQTCKAIFSQKNQDYGTAWRILRLPTLTDQIMIKAQRIRALQIQKEQRIAEGIDTEFVGIINYAIMALIQIELADDKRLELPEEELLLHYDGCVKKITSLLEKKNHDYNQAWQQMRISSMVDIILMKLLRIKNIEDLKGKVTASEGVQANYQDIVNYAVFCLIKLNP